MVDVGGGRGAFLTAILEAHPGMRGVLFDQPHVVEGAILGERGEVVGGSFFDAVPAGADAYVLKAVLHDWEDDDALRDPGAAAAPRSPTTARCWSSSATSARPTRTPTPSSRTST